MREITSKTNQNLKFIRSLKSTRSEEFILIEGWRLAKEVLRSEIKVVKSVFSEKFVEKSGNEQLVADLDQTSEAYVVSNKILDSISDTKTPQGVILVCERPNTSRVLIDKALSKNGVGNSIILCLHQIANPNNLGAIFRVAEAANICGIAVTENSADPYSPKANRAAMGSNLRIPIWSGVEFSDLIDWAKKKELIMTSADINAETNYFDADWSKPRLLIFGSEAHGLTDRERNLLDEEISIPMANGVESLNIAVSCGIILFEANKAN